ncbi:MAG: AmmeMemoRadiSam system radical SAM enzyme [Acidobacteria bacterium]|nr:AmmeMemoRadiSam system radical SAM enzyme [Acidobacteriota bacterium]
MATLADALARHTRQADPALVERYDGTWVRCFACGHACPIPDGATGVCKVRFNRGGTLMVPRGYVAGAQCDPIEKKPFFHAEPGSLAFSFGMLGCDLHCAYCQNWVTSQALRDPASGTGISEVTAADLVREARLAGARAVVSTYNEPLITSEWAVEVFREARAAGLRTGYVSNGHATPRVLEYLAPWLDLFKIDLKGFDDAQYRKLGGRLEPVLDTIRRVHAMGIWMEIVTLLVPGLNDAPHELERLTAFIAGVSPDIPWHVTAFHADYRMQDRRGTAPHMLLAAAAIGRAAGLRFVYAGNAAGRVGGLENTTCPTCQALLVERVAYRIGPCRVTPDGRCPSCRTVIPGRWTAQSGPRPSSLAGS